MTRGTDFVTIVSGLPRSGTSLLMRMLERGGMPVLVDHVRAADIDNPRGYYEFEPAKRTRHDPSWLQAAEGKAVKLVYQLLYDLPHGRPYRVLLMQRRLDEVLASQRKMLERLGTDPEPQVADAEMARLFTAELQRLDEWLARQANIQRLDVLYHELVADPAPVAEQINALLGGTLDVAAMCSVVEPELYRNRRG